MKAFFIAIGLFVFSGAFVLTMTLFGMAKAESMEEAANALYEERNGLSAEAAISCLDEWEKKWDTDTWFFLLSIPHDEVRNVSGAFKEAKSAAETGDRALYTLSLVRLCDALSEVTDSLRPGLFGVI